MKQRMGAVMFAVGLSIVTIAWADEFWPKLDVTYVEIVHEAAVASRKMADRKITMVGLPEGQHFVSEEVMDRLLQEWTPIRAREYAACRRHVIPDEYDYGPTWRSLSYDKKSMAEAYLQDGWRIIEPGLRKPRCR